MLSSRLQLNIEPVGEASGNRNKFVGPLAERAVEFGVPKVQMQSGLFYFPECKAVHLVPRGSDVGVGLALAKIGGNRNAIRQLDLNPATQTLKQILIHKARADQRRIESRQILQIIVVQVERQQMNG